MDALVGVDLLKRSHGPKVDAFLGIVFVIGIGIGTATALIHNHATLLHHHHHHNANAAAAVVVAAIATVGPELGRGVAVVIGQRFVHDVG